MKKKIIYSIVISLLFVQLMACNNKDVENTKPAAQSSVNNETIPSQENIETTAADVVVENKEILDYTIESLLEEINTKEKLQDALEDKSDFFDRRIRLHCYISGNFDAPTLGPDGASVAVVARTADILLGYENEEKIFINWYYVDKEDTAFYGIALGDGERPFFDKVDESLFYDNYNRKEDKYEKYYNSILELDISHQTDPRYTENSLGTNRFAELIEKYKTLTDEEFKELFDNYIMRSSNFIIEFSNVEVTEFNTEK